MFYSYKKLKKILNKRYTVIIMANNGGRHFSNKKEIKKRNMEEI